MRISDQNQGYNKTLKIPEINSTKNRIKIKKNQIKHPIFDTLDKKNLHKLQFLRKSKQVAI